MKREEPKWSTATQRMKRLSKKIDLGTDAEKKSAYLTADNLAAQLLKYGEGGETVQLLNKLNKAHADNLKKDKVIGWSKGYPFVLARLSEHDIFSSLVDEVFAARPSQLKSELFRNLLNCLSVGDPLSLIHI